MAEKIQLEVEIKGGESVAQASGKVENLRTKLKALKQQLASGELSAEQFNRISKEAGQLDDKLRDVNSRVKNLGSDTRRLDGFVSIAQGIAGGFAAAQGAVALFGDENKDLQKTLVKVQGAVALLSGVQAVANILQKESAAMLLINTTRTNILAAAQARYTAVVGTTTGALKALRIVGATLGIGILVAGIALLIAKFKDIKEVVGKFLPSLTAVANGFKAAWNAITDFIGVTSDATRAFDKFKAAQEKAIKTQENEIELLKASGATKKQIYDAERELLLKKNRILIESFNLNKKFTDEERKQAQENNQALKVLDATYTKDLKDEEAKRLADSQKAIDDRKKQNADAEAKRKQALLDAETDRLRILNEKNKERDAIEKESALRLLGEKDREIAELQFKYIEKLTLFKDDAETTKLLTEQMNADILAINTKYRDTEAQAKKEADEKAKEERDKQNELERQAYEQRYSIATDGLNALSQLTTAFAGKSEEGQKRAFAVNKALNISTAIIDTYMAAQKAYASQLSIPTPDAPIRANIAAGVAVASGLARVAAISSTQFGSTNGTNPSGGNRMQGGNQPNIQGYSTNNQPNQQTGQSGNMRVYVTETDIRNATRKINGIYSQATVE